MSIKRAALVAKTNVKKSRIIEGDPAAALDGFTKRVLLSLVVDVTELRKTTERLSVEVFTMAKAHGIEPPDLGED